MPLELDDLPVLDPCRNSDADVLTIHTQHLLVGSIGVRQTKLQLGLDILPPEFCPAVPPAGRCSPSKQRFEKIRKLSSISPESPAPKRSPLPQPTPLQTPPPPPHPCS